MPDFECGAFDHSATCPEHASLTLNRGALVRFRPDQTSRASIEEGIRERLDERDWYGAALPQGRTLWRIPAVFGGDHGPQLDEVADAAGLTPDDAIADIAATDLRVLALGFAPGQPYLGFLGEHWNIPRQTEVTPEVPRGAVVVAVRQVIPFANAAPTGWRQVGRTAFRCYVKSGAPAIALRAGDTVRFEPVPAKDYARLVESGPLGGATSQRLE